MQETTERCCPDSGQIGQPFGWRPGATQLKIPVASAAMANLANKDR